jgi:hypothetical protein
MRDGRAPAEKNLARGRGRNADGNRGTASRGEIQPGAGAGAARYGDERREELRAGREGETPDRGAAMDEQSRSVAMGEKGAPWGRAARLGVLPWRIGGRAYGREDRERGSGRSPSRGARHGAPRAREMGAQRSFNGDHGGKLHGEEAPEARGQASLREEFGWGKEKAARRELPDARWRRAAGREQEERSWAQWRRRLRAR